MTLANYGKQTEVYNGLDVTLNTRFGQGGQFSGGLSVGRTVTDNCFVVDSPEQARPGFCHVSPPWSAGTQVKFLVVYPLPWDLRTSATYQNVSGIPITATYPATNAQILPSLGRNLGQCRGAATCNANVTISLIPSNSVFEDRLQQVDLRFTRRFEIGRARVRGNFDVYNLLTGVRSCRRTLGTVRSGCDRCRFWAGACSNSAVSSTSEDGRGARPAARPRPSPFTPRAPAVRRPPDRLPRGGRRASRPADTPSRNRSGCL